MPLALSVQLDLVRFLAALVVFLGHASGQRLTGGLFWQIAALPNLAVIVFFVLSGWVISHVTAAREADWRSYAASRAARIYSVAVPALLIGALLDAAGSHLRPDLYHQGWGYIAEATAQRALLSLFFLNQLWLAEIVPGSNMPYWSLAYEVWYYVLFGLALFAPRRWRWPAIAACLLLIGPRIALLLLIWLLGVAGERACRARKLRPATGLALALVSLACAAGTVWVHHRLHALAVPALAIIQEPFFVYEFLIATCFTAHFIGIHAAAPWLAGPARAAGPVVRWFAGATFTLYLLHLPLAQFLRALAPWPAEHPLTRALVLGGTFIACLAIAQVTERRKEAWRRLFTRLLAPPKETAAPKAPLPL